MNTIKGARVKTTGQLCWELYPLFDEFDTIMTGWSNPLGPVTMGPYLACTIATTYVPSM